MKKLSLFLSLVFILTSCLFAFASCSEKDAESKADSAAESTVSDTSKAASEVESEVVSEVVSEVSEEVSVPDIFLYDIDRTKTKTNKALNAIYVVDSTTPVSNSWPDVEGKDFTDGNLGTADAYDAAWAGIEGVSTAYIVVDLGEQFEGLADFNVTVLNGNFGITAPPKVTVYVSEDNDLYYEVGSIETDIPYPEAGSEEWTTHTISIQLEKGVKARFIKYEISLGGWLFISELEASIYE